MNFVYTSTEIFGILIEEPMTSLTDFITGCTGLICYFRLRKLGWTDKAHLWFKHYFLFFGIAMVFAAIFGHALQYIVGFNAKCIGWTLSAIALFCLENSALSYFQKVKRKDALSWLRPLFVLQLILYLGLVMNPSTRVFNLVKANSLIGMVFVSLPLFVAFYRETRSKGSYWVICAIFATFLPGIVFNSEFTLHTYMNFHDISHLLMATCVYLLYRSCKQLGLEYEGNPNFQEKKALASQKGE